MTTKSPLEQAQERILALEAEVERLEREKECLSWNYAQSESLATDLRQESAALWQAVDELEWKGGHCPVQSCHRNKEYSDPPTHAPDCPIGVAKALRMRREARHG